MCSNLILILTNYSTIDPLFFYVYPYQIMSDMVNILSDSDGNIASVTRRDVLRLALIGLGGLAYQPINHLKLLPDFPKAERLGRVTVGMVELKSSPDSTSGTVGVLYEDAVLPWLHEVAGVRNTGSFNNQRWVETPQGYIYGPYFQPVMDNPNNPIGNLPPSSRGPGFWAEVTVPYADAILEREPSSNSWVKAKLEKGQPLRVYYHQIFWIDQIKTNTQGNVLYRVNPNYYGGVDMLWVAAEAFRPLQNEELAPISPDVTNKRILVDAMPQRQLLSCFEGKSEVYFCRISSGAKFNIQGNLVDKWATPPGIHKITRKYISLQMSGGTTGAGYDLPGIGWTTIFATGGVAIHSTFWHNNFGDPVSHGCVNVSPEDAQWIFRWTLPQVVYDPGMVDITVTGQESNLVEVTEG
jgi:lipoprotein-anchoring transpeptidase ErfK/SrfK